MRAIDHDGPVPKRAQLRDILRDLLTGELRGDAAIPSERELTARFGVSRMTVRAAIESLVAEGRLYRVRGKGTFVAPRRVESHLHLASFTNDMRAGGHRPGSLVLRADLEPAPAAVVAALRLAPGEPAYRIERLRMADGAPMAVEHGWYAAAPLPGLLDLDLRSLYTLLAEHFGLVIDSAAQTVWAESADAGLAGALGVAVGAPLMVFRRISAAGALPVEHVTSYYRGDRYSVHMSLGRLAPAVVPSQPGGSR